jgi:hypothetical protein
MSNSFYYGTLLGTKPTSLKVRLGPQIGPRDSRAPASDKDLP